MNVEWDDSMDEIPPRDRWGRPLIMPPGQTVGKLTAYTRVTTFAGWIEDTFALSQWQQRMVALGLAERPDLMVSVAAYHDDKDELQKICDAAIEVAKGRAAAGVGIALHKLTDRLDRGEPLGPVPAEYVDDLKAFEAATADLTVLGMEQFVVLDELKVAGTFDRLYEYEGHRYIGDTKTGSTSYGVGKMAIQLALYSRGQLYDPATHTRSGLGEVDQDRGIIMHLPAGQGRCELYWIDLRAGWRAVNLIHAEIKPWRDLSHRGRSLLRPMDTPTAQAVLAEQFAVEPISLMEQINSAGAVETLTALWFDNRDDWTDEHTLAARKRKAELGRRHQSIRDLAASAADK
jgi:hypothetical protein